MKKLIPLLLIALLLPQITLAAFSNTPKKLTTQGEFLKIAMAKAKKSTKGNFIKAAQKEKWISKTFQGEKIIAVKTAVEILGKMQKWPKPYEKYAKNKKILEKKFLSRRKLNKKEAILLIEKAFFSNKPSKENQKITPKTPPLNSDSEENKNPPIENSTPESQAIELYKENIIPLPDPPAGITGHFMMKKDFYEKITLADEFPTNFFQNEIYVFKGETDMEETETTVFLTYKDGNGKNYFMNFIAVTRDKKFEIPVFFEKKGKYFLGIIPGKNGNSKIVEISVGDFPEIQEGGEQQLQKISLVYENDITKAVWEGNYASIRKISFEQKFEQENKTLTIYSRQKRTEIPLLRRIFKNFKEGKIKIALSETIASSNFPLQIAGNWTKEAANEWEITRHIKTKNDTKAITFSEIPEKLTEPKTISISGKTEINIQKKAAIKKPDGFIDEVEISGEDIGDYFKTPIILKNSEYKLTYTPQKNGTYQIEINNEAGSAVINQALYIGKEIPLLPDYFEIYEQEIYPEIVMNQDELRKKMLEIMNQVRKNHGLKSVILRDDLNKLAQLHTEDMVKRKFFAHVNPDKETPQDRRKKLGIPTAVGENLAQSISILHAIHGLMNSPVHRRNILDPKWTTLGLGFSLDEEKTLITAQEFSTNPLTEEDLKNFEEEVWNTIIKKRQEAGVSMLVRDISLTEIAQTWSDKLLTLDAIRFEAPDGTSIKKLMEEKNIQRESSIFLFDTNTMENFVDYILQNTKTLEEKWTNTGFGASVSTMGDLKFTLILVK